VLTHHSAHIPEDFRKEFATHLRNFCTLRIYYGKEVDKYIGILYELIREHYQAGILHYDGKIAPHTLLNLAILALRQEDPAWLQQVLEENRGKIVSDNDDNDYYRLLWALLYSYQKNWEIALQHLPDTPFRELDYWLTHNRLELVLLYETRSPLLLYRMDAFKVQLTRYSAKHLTPIRQKPQSLFLNLLYQLVHTRTGQNKRIQKIENRILSKDFVPEKRWLLEKLAELKS
jgi:hypothetical protein